jgi:hypothetical protein
MKELQKQRQREMMEENAGMVATRRANSKTDEEETPATITAPKMEQITLPPAPQMDEPPPMTATPATATPKKTEATTPPPQAPPATRPREVEAPKKKGKKGTDEP